MFDDIIAIPGGSPTLKPSQTPAYYVWGSRYILKGGATGGPAFSSMFYTWANGGKGGGDIYLKTGTLTLKPTARISAKGQAGSTIGYYNASGGGGGGNVIIEAQVVVDEGVIFTLKGGDRSLESGGGADGQVIIATPLYTNQYIDTSGLDLANKTQTFNPGLNSIGGPHSFTVPTGVTSVTVELWGAGGGGGGGNEVSCGGCFYAGGGGGGGAYAMVTLPVTPGAQIPVTAGAGGTGSGGFGSSRGTTGKSSSFGSTTAVAGGTGGCTGWEPGSSCGGSPGTGATTNLSNGVNGSDGSGTTGGQGGNGGAGGTTNNYGAAPGGGAGGGWGAHSTGPSGGGGKVIVRW